MAMRRKGRTEETTPSRRRASDNSDYSDILDRIKPVEELPLVIAALFYGKAGTGKTTLAASFPGPVLHLDIREKGTDSIADVKGVDTIQVKTWDDFEKLYWYLKTGKHKYKSVIVDALSQLQDLATDATREEFNKDANDLITKQMWGSISGKMKTWIINYRDLIEEDINVVFLSHIRKTEGEDIEDNEVDPTIGPRLMPSVASVATAAVKILGNTFIREHYESDGNKKKRVVEYCMRLGPHGVFETKIRQPKGSITPDILVDPDYEKLKQVMRGEYQPAVRKSTVKRKVKA